MDKKRVIGIGETVLDILFKDDQPQKAVPGTEDMEFAYHDYWFHIKGAFIGMMLGVPAALAAGVIVII